MLLLSISAMVIYAQKESGIVYSDHDAITKTRSLWAAFEKGDMETFASFFADTIYVLNNSKFTLRTKATISDSYKFWENVENLSIKDEMGSVPDAVEYKEGPLWVQDWLLFTGTHKTTGVNIKLQKHCLYAFNKKGEISTFIQYYNDDVIDEIYRSTRTIENGKVYKNHPYIVTVRKLVNTYCNEDIEAMKEFYSPGAYFSSMSDKAGTTYDLAKEMGKNKKTFDEYDNITLVQMGYPDCIYYDQENIYTVFSWWDLSMTGKDGKKYSKIPVMMVHTFDDSGKINFEAVNVSSNHFD